MRRSYLLVLLIILPFLVAALIAYSEDRSLPSRESIHKLAQSGARAGREVVPYVESAEDRLEKHLNPVVQTGYHQASGTLSGLASGAGGALISTAESAELRLRAALRRPLHVNAPSLPSDLRLPDLPRPDLESSLSPLGDALKNTTAGIARSVNQTIRS
ncbi:MAG: hypothetical protein GKC10_01995 [Methanosarcinales archaeon]|nr:hypothetical protein [Methanosarcinales archaeon]